jgi:hypothetical protein
MVGFVLYINYWIEYTILYIYIKYLDNYEENKKIKQQNSNITIKTLPSKSVKGNQKSDLGKNYVILFAILVNFSLTIGAGRSSVVFKGTLKHGRFFSIKTTPVAIKALKCQSDLSASYGELKNMSRLMKIGHTNLVIFYGLLIKEG